MKQHKGNIILMVLFILVTASAFALLMMQYTQSMFDHTRMTYDYNQAYYLANAGVELGLADSLGHIGYENEYTDPDGVFCPEGVPCALTGSIIARDTYHADTQEDASECTAETAFTLSVGDSLAFPLFWKGSDGISSTTTITIHGVDGDVSLDAGATVWTDRDTYDIARLNGVDNFVISRLKTNDGKHPSGKEGEYLVLINNNSSPVSFCLDSDKTRIPRARLRVDGQGQFRDYAISLSAAKKVTLPGFLFSTSVGR